MAKPQTCNCFCDPSFGNQGVTEYCNLHAASPDLLTALEAAAPMMIGSDHAFGIEAIEKVRKQVNAAIALARGE